ncbi:DUF4114 domain-containing protein [Leptothoe sp. ISB3NOV94-8A]
MPTNNTSTHDNLIADPLGSNNQAYQVMNNTDLGKGQLFALDPITGDYLPIGTASGFKYNAMAYDPGTDFLYAIAAGSGSDATGVAVNKGDLIRIDVGGETFLVGPTGLNTSLTAAAIIDDSMIASNNGKDLIVSIDLTTGAATELTYTDDTQIPNDWVAIDNKLYGVSKTQLKVLEIDGNNASITNLTLTGGPSKMSAGAMWAATNSDGEKELYAFENATGDIYRIDNFDGATPDAVKVATGVSPSNSNDGARNAETEFTVPDTGIFSGEGIFTTGDDGIMAIDYLYDGGSFQSQIAVFSMDGMDAYEAGSEAFIQEAARRALTSTEGHVLIKDASEGARFTYDVDWEPNFAHGQYQGIKRFSFEPGTQFAVMLVQNTSVQNLADDPSLAAQFGKQALFSIPEANTDGTDQGRIVDLNGLSAEGQGAYAMEDVSIVSGSDRDYNDVVFQIMGATAEASPVEDFASNQRSFKDTELGSQIVEYSSRGSFYSGGTFTVGEQSTMRIDYLFDGGAYESELGVFSLKGMEEYEPGSEAFIQEATRRALTNSTEGYLLIKDNSEGAKFTSEFTVWEPSFNDGTYKGEKTFVMTPGDEFAVLLVQHTNIRAINDDPALAQEQGKRIIFSIPEANDGHAKGGQIVDINGGSTKGWGTYAIEDEVIGLDGSDRDYNDIVFQLRGATAQGVEAASDIIRPTEDWLNTPLGQELLADARPFKEGSFMTDDSGVVSFDYLYDGGGFRGELAIFSLTGMEEYAPGSEVFIQEAAQRALSNSKQGYVVVQDRKEGARFEGDVSWEDNFNEDPYRGVKTFELNSNEQFAVMLLRKASVTEIAADPSLALQSETRALFSIPEANGDGTLAGQIVDLNGSSSDGQGLYAMEDMALDGESADRDYNDIVFQIRGAAGDVVSVDEKANKTLDFLSTNVGQKVLDYANREHLYTEGTFAVGETGEVTVDFLFDGGGFHHGELGIFNLSGMENYALDSEEFLQEAAQRAISNSNLGYVVVQDKKHSARFQGKLDWEADFNDGVHVGEQTFTMNAGDQFALILSQNVGLAKLAQEPSLASNFGKQALFSIAEANPGTQLASQIVDLNGLGGEGKGVFGMEDIQAAEGGSDKDFNDVVIQIEGAISMVTSADGEIHSERDWRELALGEDILTYASKDFDQHLKGGIGRQTLVGGDGDDLLEGFKGIDTLVGGLGDDILTGGAGKDTFVLNATSGMDIITDFQDDYDVLGMADGLTYSDLNFADSNILLANSNAVIATLSGFDTTTLTAADFISV